MSAGFAVVESLAFIGCSCAPCGARAATAGIGRALCVCAAKAEDSRGFSRIAATTNKTHEIAAMVRTDERRTSSSGKCSERDAIPHWWEPLVTPGHPPLFKAAGLG